MQLIVYVDPPELMTERVNDWTGATDNMISHGGDPTRWSAGDVERVRDKVVQWLMAQPRQTSTATRVPLTQKSPPKRYRDGSLDEPTLKVGVQVGSGKAWVEIAGLRREVIDEVLTRRPED